jgi:signal transduction histidine kinase
MGEGPLEILPQPVELATVIDGAVADTSAQLREKNIALRVDLPEEMPEINADRDAIQQIVLHLLQNAGAATPPEGTITLRAHIQKEDKDDYLLLQVSDTGGGIRAEDLPRVFTRRYRADLPLIEGLGDTGVGLSIAKALVEAHGGRIWVDSQMGESTTFSVLLPIHPVMLSSTSE